MISINEMRGEIRIVGHADYAPVNYDIVCAGVSALFITLVDSLEKLTDAKILWKTEPGLSYVKYEGEEEDAKLLIRS